MQAVSQCAKIAVLAVDLWAKMNGPELSYRRQGTLSKRKRDATKSITIVVVDNAQTNRPDERIWASGRKKGLREGCGEGCVEGCGE